MAVKTYSLKKDGEKFLSAHFQVKEFRCKDGSDKILINTDLIDILEKLRAYLNCKSITINSGYRTPSYCVKIGSFKNSQHTKGNAADINCKKQDGTLYTSNQICCALEDLNYAGGVGRINKNYAVHVDCRGYKCWFDEVNNEKTTNSWYSYLGIKKPESTVKGDINNDKKVTAADARGILRHSAGLEKLEGQPLKNADVNNDGKVTAADARDALRNSAGVK